MASRHRGVENIRAASLSCCKPRSASTGGAVWPGSEAPLLPSDSPLGRGVTALPCLCFLFGEMGMIIPAATLGLNGDFNMSHVLNMYVKSIQ